MINKINQSYWYFNKYYNISASGIKNSKNSDLIPFLIINKKSNFSSDEFTLYSEKNKPIFSPEDICSTLAVLLGINIPKMNQGKFIEETVQLNTQSEIEQKLSYLDLRNQQQRLLTHYMKSK